jgi:membrane-associated protease RseP (regulator of RpoE activity)
MSTRGTILLAIGMLILGLLLGALGGAAAGFSIGQNARPAVSQNIPTARMPMQPVQPPQQNTPVPSNPRGLAPFANISGGARVEVVEKDSPAEKAGLKVGDVITAVGGTKLDTDHALADLIQAHKPGEKVDLAVTRGSQTLTVSVELGASSQDSSKAYLGIRYTPMIPGGQFRSPSS